MVLENLPAFALCIGGWMVLNGLLHEVFVLRSEHGKKYDRELLRLLMDGHILITCGAIQTLVCRGLHPEGVRAERFEIQMAPRFFGTPFQFTGAEKF
jgi:hypothetical protein